VNAPFGLREAHRLSDTFMCLDVLYPN